MDFFQFLTNIMNLPEEQKDCLVNALLGLCQEKSYSSEYIFRPMDDSIKEDNARAKEYFRITQGEIPKWIYSNVNWGRVYQDLCKEGLLLPSPQGILMKLKARK